MVPRKQLGCIDMTFLVAVPGGYALLVLLLGRWVAHLLGVGFLVVALPLAVVPIPIAFGKYWRNSWIFVVPVAATVLVARRWAAVGDWKEAAGAAFTGAFLWLLALIVIAAVVRGCELGPPACSARLPSLEATWSPEGAGEASALCHSSGDGARTIGMPDSPGGTSTRRSASPGVSG